MQAAKAAVMNFFDTLRVELGANIGGITIVTPGWIQSDMTMGRFVDKKGNMEVREDKRDVSCGWQHLFFRHCFLLDIFSP